jgi:diguanylate cyclase (GGDEF)-like protein/putative nucleotidyltransferase with HDIG domain
MEEHMASFDWVTDDAAKLKALQYFMDSFRAEVTRSTRLGQMFSVIMLALDGFKQLNERHGRLECDKVLAAVANLLRDGAQQSNVVAPFGQGGFVVLMPETSTEQAEVLAERLRSNIESDPYLAAHGVTASLGIATFPVHGRTQTEILGAAHAGIRVANQEGGNRVRVASLTTDSAQGDWERPATSFLDTVPRLASANDAKDDYPQGHSQAVSKFAAQIARQMGLTDSFIEEVRCGAVLHDIGMIGVPEAILNKPSALTPEEYELMKTHAVKGAKILEPLKVKAVEPIRGIVRHHHERWDGNGYPDGLKGENIPLGARIIGVAEAFDAIVSDRVYQQGRSVEEAVAELRRCSGTQFDPNVVEAFVRSLETPSAPRPPRVPG